MTNVSNTFAGLQREHLQDSLRISFPTLGKVWAALSIMFTLLFTYPLLLSISDPTQDLWDTLFLALISLGFLYASLVSLFNRSVVQVNQSELKVTHGPLPYASSKTLDSTNIKQIYVRLVRAGRSTSYDLYVLTRNNLHEKFLTVRNGELGLYLEQEIERFLGIEDQVVRGEWRPEPYLWE